MLIALPLAKLRRKRLLLTVLGSDIRYLPRLLNRWIFSLVNEIIIGAPKISDELEKFGVREYRVIPFPVDECRFNRERNFSSIRQEFGLNDEWVVTFVGRLDDFKDPLTFVRAVPEIRRRLQKVRFFLVGDGELGRPVENLIVRYKLQGVVHLTGFREDVEGFLGISDLFVALSPDENTWSSTIAEAMFMEVPCIITDAGYSSKLFAHRENCLLIPPRDETALADAVVEMNGDSALRVHLAEGGKELLQRYHRTIPEITQATLNLYCDHLGQARVKEEAPYS